MNFQKSHSGIRPVTILISYCLIMFSVGCENELLNPSSRSTSTNESFTALDGADGAVGGAGGLYDTEDGYYPGTEQHGELSYNAFVFTAEDNLSTFGVDVDAGSYTFGRGKINADQIPAPASVRVEEYINYFRQDYTAPSEAPFSVNLDGAPSPFRGDSLHLLRIGLQGRLQLEENLPWNLTFLVDVSGSMTSKMNLVKQSLNILVDNMRLGDQISICTYASHTETILNPTTLEEQDAEAIKNIIAGLTPGGSTAMGAGLQNAYEVNTLGFLENGVNRVIVCSDGDANVGGTTHEAMLELISDYVDQGITLSTLGYGVGNYNDELMEQLADQGDGNNYYIDTLEEATRLFTEELLGVLQIIAKDVKIQVEFNPVSVIRYRLIGYENRDIADEEFEDDETDAGDIGAGHRVTALYELELNQASSAALGTVHLRYKQPHGDTDIPVDFSIQQSHVSNDIIEASNRFMFTAAIAEYAELLRESPFASSNFSAVEELISATMDSEDDRDIELLYLIQKLQDIE